MTLNHVEIEVGMFMTSIPYAIQNEILAIKKLGLRLGWKCLWTQPIR